MLQLERSFFTVCNDKKWQVKVSLRFLISREIERGRDCACYLLRECVSRSRELGMIFLQTGEVIKSSASAVSCVGACVPFAKNMCGSLVLSLSLSLSSFSFTQIYLAYDDTVRRRRRRECCRTTLHSFSRLKLFIEISKNGLSDVLRLL